jgi:hypothetical protein
MGGEKYRQVYSSETGINEFEVPLELEKHEAKREFIGSISTIKKSILKKQRRRIMPSKIDVEKNKIERIKIGDKIIDFLFVSDGPKKLREIYNKIFPNNNSKKVETLVRNLTWQITKATRGVVKSDEKKRLGYYIDPSYNKESGSAPIKEAWMLNYSDAWKKTKSEVVRSKKKEGKLAIPKKKEGKLAIPKKKNLEIPAGRPVRMTITKMLDAEINISSSHEISIRARSMDGIIEVL